MMGIIMPDFHKRKRGRIITMNKCDFLVLRLYKRKSDWGALYDVQ